MWSVILSVLLALTSCFLIFLILLQRGRGGGLAGAFGGLGGQSAFGTKAGDVFTRITIVVAVIWVALAGVNGCVMGIESEGRYVAPPTVALKLSDSPLAEAGGVATVTATLSAVSDEDVTVDLAFSGTATNVIDYTPSDVQIMIPAGSKTGSITLTAVEDTLVEPNETIVVEITSVTNGTESETQQVTATITDDAQNTGNSTDDNSDNDGAGSGGTSDGAK